MIKHLYSKDGIYADFSYGAPAPNRGLLHAIFVTQRSGGRITSGPKILCIGSGNGYEIVHFRQQGYKCFGIDLYVPDVDPVKSVSTIGDARFMPFKDKEFDLAFCCETFEHLPMDTCDMIMKEVGRVARNFYFTIATRGDPPFNAHVNKNPAWYWIKYFEDKGMKIKHAEAAPELMIMGKPNLVGTLTFDDGVVIYGSCSP